MKLFYSPGSCSLAPHIILQEIGMIYELEPVNLKTKHYRGGTFTDINPKGYVPVLELNSQYLTECTAILEYLADQKQDLKLIPKAGTMDRYRCHEWLNFIATEIHKGFSPLWNSKMPAEAKEIALTNLSKRFDYLNEHLTENKFLMGSQFTVADAYLFTVINWAPMLKIEMVKWPKLMGHFEAVKSRPATMSAMKAEGLLK